MLVAAAASAASPVAAQKPSDRTLSASELFLFADRARDAGDYPTAEAAYRALADNPNRELRTEARFRLGMMLADRQHRYREAATEFRHILDENPKAVRVRLELARMHAELGHPGAAERELRAAQASRLPADVERVIRFYANALNARKSFGGNLEVALAPDTNINRATKSDTLGTVIGNFALDQNARARSGLGLSLRGQTYARLGDYGNVKLLARLSGSADLYRQSQFNDVILSFQAGPEVKLGKDQLTLSLGPALRWYGGERYSNSLAADANWRHPLGTRAQVTVDGSAGQVRNLFNRAQDGENFALSTALDRALSSRLGGGLQLFASRFDARDPGFSDVTVGGNAYAFREIGRMTAVLSLGYSRLEGDARLLLFPQRRQDDRYTAIASATWRGVQFRGLAPFARMRVERNRSTVGLYDFRRVAAEFGLTSAF